MLCRCSISYWFSDWSRDVAIIGAKLAKIGNMPAFLELTFHNRWQKGKADGRINSAEVLHRIKIW